MHLRSIRAAEIWKLVVSGSTPETEQGTVACEPFRKRKVRDSLNVEHHRYVYDFALQAHERAGERLGTASAGPIFVADFMERMTDRLLCSNHGICL